jgi:hypothetical protein
MNWSSTITTNFNTTLFQIIFALSNPTSKSECSAEEAYRWSNNKAVFASGSPFPKYEQDGVVFEPGQVTRHIIKRMLFIVWKEQRIIESKLRGGGGGSDRDAW